MVPTPQQRSVTSPRSAYAHRLHEFPGLAFPDAAAFQHHGRWREFFRSRIGPAFDGQVIFEVGCFDAGYLCRLAVKHPRAGFVGLEWKCKAVYDGARRVAEMRLANVALLRGRAQDIGRIFAAREVDEIWVLHPDPCDRPAELKNRLIAEPFMTDAHAVLRDGYSTLTLKTDHPGYYQWVLGLLGLPQSPWFRDPSAAGAPRVRARDLMPPAAIPGANEAIRTRFRVTANSADFWNDPAALAHASARPFAGEATLFESRFLKKRLPIYYLELAKR